MDENGGCWDDDITSDYMDVGQNGRLRGPQMEMSSLVLSIHNFGVPNFDPYPHTYFEIALMW